MKSLGIIGFGNMGEAMVRGLKKEFPGLKLYVSEKNPDRLKQAVSNYGATDCTNDAKSLFQNTDVVVLAIKPQDLDTLSLNILPYSEGKSVISILAGKTIDTLYRASKAVMIARFMPSLAASVQKSIVGMSFSSKSTKEFITQCQVIAKSLGRGIEIPEKLMPAIIGTSGSGIAFGFQYLHAMALAGTKAGIGYDDSLDIAMEVLEGAVALVRETGLSPVDLITRVCSPGGTTIEGIAILEKKGFTSSLIEATEAVTKRSKELEQ